MKFFIACALLISALVVQAKSTNATDACPDFPAPKSARLQSVAEEMSFNDVPMSIRRFDSGDAPNAILAYYREQWASSDKKSAPIEYPMGNWKVIAVLRGSCFFTVQVMTDGKTGSTGFLGVSAPPAATPQIRDDLPMMTGSKVVNNIAHSDGGKVGRTVLLSNGFSPDTNAVFYRNAYAGRGWQVLNDYRMERSDDRGSVVVMKNGLREMTVTATKQGDNTQVLLNFMSQP